MLLKQISFWNLKQQQQQLIVQLNPQDQSQKKKVRERERCLVSWPRFHLWKTAMHPGFSQCARVDVSRTSALSLNLHWKFWTFSNSVSAFSHVILNVSLNLWHSCQRGLHRQIWSLLNRQHTDRLIQYHSFRLNLRSRFWSLFCSHSPFQCRLDRFRPLHQRHPLLQQQKLLQNNQQLNLWRNRIVFVQNISCTSWIQNFRQH